VERARSPIARLPVAHLLSKAPDRDPNFDVLALDEPDLDRPDLDEPDFEEDDPELDPNTGELFDPSDLDEDDEEPEPEYGDFWHEPDEFDD
jgi:hypothetical protein